MTPQRGWSRRAWLIGAGGVAVALPLASCSLIPPIPKRPLPTAEDAAGWLRLASSGRFVLSCPRAEMGQNVLGAVRRLAAHELGVPESLVTVQVAGTADIPRAKATVGSDSVRELREPLASACARLRTALLARAATRLGAAPATLLVEAAGVRAPGGAVLPWAALASPPLTLPPPSDATRPRPGRPAADPALPPPQFEALVRGAPLFTADVWLPDMLHAMVVHPPWRMELGPRLEGWDEAAVRAVPGFVAQLTLPEVEGVVLVARSARAAWAMRRAANVRWTPPLQRPDPMAMVDVDRALAEHSFTRDRGEIADASGAWTVDLRLDVPMAAHAGIEPRCAVARFNTGDDGPALELWCGSQDPFYVRDVMARDHGLPLDRIHVHNQRIGGGFGARAVANIEREVAFIARAVQAPVKLQWTREDEFVAGFHRPPSSHRVRVRVGADGLITDWWHALSSSHIIFTSAAMPPWMQSVARLVGDPGTSRGHQPPYATGRQRLSLQLTRLPLATGPWRGLGAGPNVLAVEAAMDAAAAASGQSPLAFRLRHLARAEAGEHLESPARLATVLRRAAERADGAPLRPAGQGERVGRGLACGVYKGRSVAAAVAEVVVTADRIRVTRLWCSHDCGAIVDEAGVRAQVEGNLAWCLGLVLSDELAAPDATPASTQLSGYALPRIGDMPRLDIDLVPSDEAPGPAGETAIVAGAGAIYNAIAAATGRRPGRLPVRPQALAVQPAAS
jgi:isoquinoline 1-oxidoreductase beta subunit